MKLHEFRLSNGLKVFHLHDPSATAACVQVWYRVGCAHEDPDKRGIAHLLEHMMFKGTERIAPEEHARRVQKLGGQSNAFTTEDVTVYVQTLPAKHWTTPLELEADRMCGLRFPEDHFTRERAVVVEEYNERILNQPITRTLQSVRRKLFNGHPYAVDPAGILEHVKAFTRADIIRFYRKYYHPGNAVVVLAGPMPEAAAEEKVRELFSPLLSGETQTPPIPAFPDSMPATIRSASPVKVNFYTRVYALPRKPEHYHRLQMLNLLLGDGENALLRRKVEDKRMGVLHAGSFHYSTQGGDLFFLYAAVLPFMGFARTLRDIHGIMEGDLPCTPSDLDEIKGRVRISLASQLTGTEKRANRLGETVVLRDSPDAFFTDDAAFANITLRDLEEAFSELKHAPATEIKLKARWFPGNR